MAHCYVIAALFFAFPVCAAALPAVAAPAPARAPWDNPFCDASASVIPFDSPRNAYSSGGDTYALYVWAHARSNYAARVTLVGDGQAYAVDIPRVAEDTAHDGESAYLVSFPKRFSAEWYFVDGVGIDGAAIADCPSFVKPVMPIDEIGPGVPAIPPRPASFGRVNARYVGPLPATPCGAVYTELKMTKSYQPIVGQFGGRRLSVDVEVFVDSDGNVVKTDIRRSSGVEGIDDAAIAAMQYSAFRPATFLCTPVVSSERVTIDYTP
jgi:TonB family protein